MLKKQQNNWAGVKRLSDKRKEKRRVRGTTLGMEGKATAETRGRRVATNGADSGEPPAKGSWGYKAASTRGWRGRCAPPPYSSTAKDEVEEAASGGGESTAASLNPALMSLRFEDGLRNNVA